VYKNGEKVCTAGIGEFGVMATMITWVAHHPDKLARWAAEGAPPTAPLELDLSVSGLVHDRLEPGEHLDWLKSPLVTGDEIRIRIIDASASRNPGGSPVRRQ